MADHGLDGGATPHLAADGFGDAASPWMRRTATPVRFSRSALLLLADPLREIEQRAKAILERCVTLDLAPDVADDATEPAPV